MTLECRIGIRLPKETRIRIDELIQEGKVESISDFVKQAIREKLERQ